MEIDEQEEEQLRDIAIRLGAAIGMHPEAVLERLIVALEADTIFRMRKSIEAMKDNFWDEAMLPIYEAILERLDNHKG